MLKDSTKVFDEQITDVNDINSRKGIAFSLWSGCLSAGKTIALGTRDRENTPESRMEIFTYIIDPLCKIDELYKAGVETAPIFKRLRKDDIDFEGVPDGSPVRLYKDTAYKE